MGLGVFGLAPSEFWNITPKEFDALLAGRFGVSAGSGPMSSLELAGLMARFPDEAADVW